MEDDKDISLKFPFNCNSRYIYDIKYRDQDYHCRGMFKYILYFHFNRDMLKKTLSVHRKYASDPIDKGDAYFLMNNLIIDDIDIIPNKNGHSMNSHEKTINSLFYHITITKNAYKHRDGRTFIHNHGGDSVYYDGRFVKINNPLDYNDVNNILHICAYRFVNDLKKYISLYKLPTIEEHKGSFTRIFVGMKKVEYDASDIFERINKMYEMWIEEYVDLHNNPQNGITIPY